PGEARFKIFTRGGSECALTVTAPDGERFHETFAVHDGIAAGAITLPKAILWDPTNPQLYKLELALGNGDQSDVVHGYFGIRSIETKPAENIAAPAALSLN